MQANRRGFGLINRITQACIGAGAYTISVGSMNPAIVLPRLLEALAGLNPRAHRDMVAPDGPYASIPAEMLRDASNPWWETARATGLVQRMVSALNAAAPAGFCCVYSEGDRLELARHDAPLSGRDAAPTPPPGRRFSTVRCRVLMPTP